MFFRKFLKPFTLTQNSPHSKLTNHFQTHRPQTPQLQTRLNQNKNIFHKMNQKTRVVGKRPTELLALRAQKGRPA